MSSQRHTRTFRVLGAAVVACGFGLLPPGVAAADGLVSEPVFGAPHHSTVDPRPLLDFPEFVDQPGWSMKTIESRPVERSGDIGAELLGSQPLGGGVSGGSYTDIIPHDNSTRDSGHGSAA